MLAEHALGSMVMDIVRGEHRGPAMAMLSVVPREERSREGDGGGRMSAEGIAAVPIHRHEGDGDIRRAAGTGLASRTVACQLLVRRGGAGNYTIFGVFDVQRDCWWDRCIQRSSLSRSDWGCASGGSQPDLFGAM